MRFLVDMNLTPRWVRFLSAGGMEAVHWSEVGSGGEADAEICEYAREHGYTVLTNDLDFPQILAHTKETGPSVVLLRCAPLTPEVRGEAVTNVVRECATELERGAVLTVDWTGEARARLLPLR